MTGMLYEDVMEKRSPDLAQAVRTSVLREMGKHWFVLFCFKQRKDMSRVELSVFENVLRSMKGQH